ncbi:hypothetical protein DVH26_05665 [Paenibacillus sp. H1-7]|uniref:hypothetical protein n=1 Tax=Paenibacillus sp. H1-7 TaxID=2282849 RepID=UPI001EF86436|nr:hypothetical protein [Paenibacillus sp. H1-7]ULL13979.1 hypothetical protein DVH26_05665 [Paenibacillus sp. H1-7]
MPDWSYQTIFRPLLFSLPSEIARDFTLHAMGSLSKIPGGSFVIRTLGHMEASPLLESELAGIRLRYPVGLSGSLDPNGVAHRAIAQFGIGFIEIGPVTVEEIERRGQIVRDAANEEILYPDAYANPGLDATVQRMKRKQGHRLPLMLRIRSMPDSTPEEALLEQKRMLEALEPYAAGFYIDVLEERWELDETVQLLEAVVQAAKEMKSGEGGGAKPLFLYIPLDYPLPKLERLLDRLRMEAWAGMVAGEAIRTEEGSAIGRSGKQASADKLRLIRGKCGPEVKLIACGGIHEPRDALDLLQAGASYVQLHSGLVYSGPGLPKRINEAIVYELIRNEAAPAPKSFWTHWGWMCLLGIGMMIGGIIAWLIAATTVVLPYDTQFLGMAKASLSQANPLLLGFMSHDRVTLAGTMISIGILYFQFAYHGLRYGLHWAKSALLMSCIVGFSSFFLYLGYGYFDPLHALAAAILLPMFILSMRGNEDLPPRDRPNTANDRHWRRAQWGQLMMVMLGFSLAVGGLVIAFVGVTRVFVPQDLQYLCATPQMLADINDRLIPLIAHDRAGFGGALFSNAVALLAAALWGINKGQRWLWWTFLIGGFPGFLAGFSIHWAIGYTSFIHLLPAYFAFGFYAAGLLLLYPYMMAKEEVQGGSVDKE